MLIFVYDFPDEYGDWVGGNNLSFLFLLSFPPLCPFTPPISPPPWLYWTQFQCWILKTKSQILFYFFLSFIKAAQATEDKQFSIFAAPSVALGGNAEAPCVIIHTWPYPGALSSKEKKETPHVWLM